MPVLAAAIRRAEADHRRLAQSRGLPDGTVQRTVAILRDIISGDVKVPYDLLDAGVIRPYIVARLQGGAPLGGCHDLPNRPFPVLIDVLSLIVMEETVRDLAQGRGSDAVAHAGAAARTPAWSPVSAASQPADRDLPSHRTCSQGCADSDSTDAHEMSRPFWCAHYDVDRSDGWRAHDGCATCNQEDARRHPSARQPHRWHLPQSDDDGHGR